MRNRSGVMAASSGRASDGITLVRPSSFAMDIWIE